MEPNLFEQHLRAPRGRGPAPDGAVLGAAGGAACGDLVRVALRAAEGRVEEATFDAEGCGAVVAAGSVCVELVQGAPLLDAARVGTEAIARALGGLTPAKLHAAEIAADALHRALSRLWSSDAPHLAREAEGRILVGLSGGVDSAVAALLARSQGAEVVAVTLKLWADAETDESRSCCSPQAVLTARDLAHSMGLPHMTLDLEERFRSAVVARYVSEHDAGRTPNPCIACNGLVRFDAMLALAARAGAEALATGHYARIVHDADGALLACAADVKKDQAYMLCALTPEKLERVRFPLGELGKPAVRQIARDAGLAVADKRESQDLCFMSGTNRARFLARHASVRDREGEIVDRQGRKLGRHRGHRHFTVGQRRGLGIAAREPLYVLAKDARHNRVVVGSHADLAVRRVELERCRLYRDGGRVDGVRLRYRSGPVGCSLDGTPGAGEHDWLSLTLGEPVHGVAAGQTACLLEGDKVLGCGTIA